MFPRSKGKRTGRELVTVLILIFSSIVFVGCLNTVQESAQDTLDENGRHLAGWIEDHGSYYESEESVCGSCHGQLDDPASSGGIARISCFEQSINGQACHPNGPEGPGNHPDNWLNKQTTDFHGFAYQADADSCLSCHDPRDPQSSAGYNCLDCHFSENGRQRVPPGSDYAHRLNTSGHTTFSSAEKEVCIACHETNNRFGLDPFCHNCHEIASQAHPDPDWSRSSVHGPAAKSTPGAMQGFGSCQSCHGDGFDGGTASVSCQDCHGTSAPHPARSEWVNNDAPSHRDTDPANAAVCADCHLGGRNSTLSPPSTPAPGTQPGCFNGTLCHPGGSDFHPSGWLDKANRGTDTWHATAYQTDLQINGLVCTDCHTPPPLDTPPDGQCTTCHFGSSGNREVSGWSHGRTGHKDFKGTTGEPVCVACHEINNQLGYSPECHNCHGSGAQHPDPDWSLSSVHGPAAKSAPGSTQGFASCQVCHGDAFDGGTASVSCQTCHGINAPHPEGVRWSNNTGPTHTDTDPGNAVICSDCHLNGQDSTLPPPPAPAPGTQPGCFNGTLCHSDAGYHPDPNWSWSSVHGPAAKAAPGPTEGFGSCQTCHGDVFDGGSAGVSCQTCHGTGAPHPEGARWSNNTGPTHTDTDPGNAVICSDCHLNGQNTTLPPPPTPAPGTQPGCFNGTLCHDSSTHSSPYLDHDQDVPTQSAFNNSCDQCHSTTGSQPDQSARRCDDCHAGGSPYTYTNCRSCHANPPNSSSPAGNTSPNRDGEHGGPHNYSCTECHGNQGSGSGLNHYEPNQAYLNMDLSFTRTSSQVTCNGTCHGEDHGGRRWY